MLQTELVIVAVGAVASGVVSYYVGKKREREREQEVLGNRLDTLETTIEGQEGSRIVSGITDVVEMHDQELEDIDTRLEQIEEKAERRGNRIKKIESDVERLKQRCERRQDGE